MSGPISSSAVADGGTWPATREIDLPELVALLRRSRMLLAVALVASLSLGALYVLLSLETASLLVGATLLFAVLAAVMALTRRIDWYALGGRTADPPELAAAGTP